MMRFRCLTMLTCLAIFIGVSLPAHTAAAAELPWSRLRALPKDFSPSALAYENTNRAWVVGMLSGVPPTGAIFRLELSQGIWYPTVRFDVTQPLDAVFVRSADDVWAAGNKAFVAHITGLDMATSTITSNQGVVITSLAADGNTLWAIGHEWLPHNQYQGFIAHQSSSGWEQLDLPIEADTVDLRVAIFQDGALWIASSSNVLRYVANTWTDMTPAYCEQDTFCSQSISDLVQDRGGPLILVQRYGGCAICTPHSDILQWDGTSWQTMFSVNDGSSLGTLATAGDVAMVVGTSTRQISKFQRAAQVFERHSGSWTAVPTPQNLGRLTHVALLDAAHALLIDDIGSIVSYGYPYQAGLALDARVSVSDPQQSGVDFFPETGHTLRGEFRNRWRQFGGLAQFGYPLTEEIMEINRTDGQTYLVQYFERARFELHPELPQPYNVLLGLLGRSISIGREGETPFVARSNPGTGYYTAETGHTIAPEFLRYWQTHGALLIFGYPISESFVERNPADGHEYLVQYFERNRFELHPELPEPYRVSLGLLGVETLMNAGIR